MPPHSPVADYLDALSRELAFDPSLSNRVRHEVHDHLWEAVLSAPAELTTEAEQRAVDRFGDPRDIAARYRATSLYARMRRAGALLVFAMVGIFLAMESRVAWYGLKRWEPSERLKTLGNILLPIDHHAFLLAIALGIAGWLYIMSRSTPANYRPVCRVQLRRCQFLTVTAAIAIAVSVTIEALLTTLRLTEARWSFAALVPAGSIVVEVILILMTAVYMRNTIRRAALCQALSMSPTPPP